MIERTRISRFVRQVTRLAGLLLGVVLIFVLIEMAIGRRKDEKAVASANVMTANYRHQFVIGEPRIAVESALKESNASTLDRGEAVLVIAREGRQVWYCSHNYFGTALQFADGKLQQVKSDEWLDTCL